MKRARALQAEPALTRAESRARQVVAQGARQVVVQKAGASVAATQAAAESL